MAPRTAEWELAPDPDRIAAVRHEVAALAASAGMLDSALHDLQVAVSDALTNAVLHGRDNPCGRRIRVRADAHERRNEIVVRVREGGRLIAERPNCEVLGPRLLMIAALARAFKVAREPNGATELRMQFALGRS